MTSPFALVAIAHHVGRLMQYRRPRTQSETRMRQYRAD